MGEVADVAQRDRAQLDLRGQVDAQGQFSLPDQGVTLRAFVADRQEA